MIKEALQLATDFDKIPARMLVVLLVVLGAILFLPAGAWQSLGFAPLDPTVRTWCGISFLFIAAWLVVSIPFWFYDKRVARQKKLDEEQLATRRRDQRESDFDARIDRLDAAEQGVIWRIAQAGGRSMQLPVTNPAVASLLRARILERTSHVEEYSYEFDGPVATLRITDWALPRVRLRMGLDGPETA